MIMKFLNGIGYARQNLKGKFEVRTDKRIKTFKYLINAREHYDTLRVEKTIWNVAKEPNELLEYHQLLTNKKK